MIYAHEGDEQQMDKSGRGHKMEGQEPCDESIATFQNNPGSPKKSVGQTVHHAKVIFKCCQFAVFEMTFNL